LSAYFALIPLIGFVPFAARRLLIYLHLFQQEEYDGPRFLRWLIASRAWDRRLSLALLCVGGAQLVFGRDLQVSIIAACLCVAVSYFEQDPRKSAKKPLAMTTRAKRIYGVALVVALAIGLLVGLVTKLVLVWIVAVQLIPLALVAGNAILMPFEKRVRARYWREAHEILGKMNPMVIGITGSYGKTSVKHILGHVLETAGPTLITPGSVNTAMGIARIIRERLQPHHRYFVVEMGAYGIGSIKHLCDLTPPHLGIITAIGKAHYERFKSLDAVSHAKFELAEAARDNDGKVVVNADVLGFPWPREFVDRHADSVVTVGEGRENSVAIRSLCQDSDGIAATVSWRGQEYELRAPLFGLHQGRNIALAFAAACEIGLAPEDVVASLRSTPQIAHRLEVTRQGNGSILIDDAYNSNPVGFTSALSLLDTLRPAGGRRILVTPGMVELGAEHDAEHARIGRLAASHVDVLLAVAPHRVAPLADAFKAAAPQQRIISCDTFADARSWLDRNVEYGDVVLLENDLPDLLERKLRL
jgi:UDP-N-acetylmuramoyl-tripeptide--D-alanyl-D-alanine ligase